MGDQKIKKSPNIISITILTMLAPTLAQLLLLFLLPLVSQSLISGTLNTTIKAAVQNQNEIYFSYLGYNSACNYSQPDISVGSVLIEQLSAGRLFEEIQYQGELVYWTPVYNGFALMMLIQETIAANYSGYILYNSKVKFPSRQIILYSLTFPVHTPSPAKPAPSPNLTFYYAIPTINIRNGSLAIKIVSTVEIGLDEESSKILNDCNFFSEIGQANFAFVGQESFIFVCGAIESGFMFTPSNQSNITILDLSGLGIDSYVVSTNPFILTQQPFSHTQSRIWNNAILVYQNGSTQASTQNMFFFNYNFQTLNYTFLSLHEMQPEISLLINRIWGAQIKKQFNRWMDLFTDFNLTQNKVLFPGNIVSVFVSDRENIFVEYDTVEGFNFLCVFDSEGVLYWNITYLGSIVYYGSKNIFIYNKIIDKFYYIEVERPIYTLDVSTLNDTEVDTISNFSVLIPCQTQLVNITYEILWTTSDFPTALILYKNSTPIYTTDVVYGFSVEDRFEVVGPDFQLIINSPPTIQVIIIDSSTIVINEHAIGIISVSVYDGNFMTVIFVTNNSIYSVNSRLTKKALAIQPCGFNTITGVVKQQGGGDAGDEDTYVITNDKGQQCQCSSDFVECHLVTSADVYSGVIGGGVNGYLYGSPSFYSYLNSMQNDVIVTSAPNPNFTPIKRNLYALIGQGYIISILQNNTILLLNTKTHKILDSYSLPCAASNQTNGDVYIKEFYDPFLIVYCEGSSSIFQFVVRKQQLMAQREIPLYRFRTRAGEFTFFPAYTFIFIAVDPLVEVFPLPKNCCVLRLDPCVFTVSVIIEIVSAYSIIAVTNYRNIDIALFRASSAPDSQFIIKAYFPNPWITLNQTNHSAIVDYQNVTVIFESANYNFAASFQLNIVFNLTEINLGFILDEQEAALQSLNLNFESKSTKYGPLLVGSSNYSLSSYVCGPIFTSVFYRQVHNMTNLQIIQQDILTKTKVLSNFGIEFIQLINPTKFGVQNLTLNDLMLAVAVDRMFVYVKVLDDVQMVGLGAWTLPERRCTYYLLDVINSTAATLTANCQGINYDFRSPLLTINYVPETVNFTMTYEWIIVPLDLRQIYTIVRGGNQSTLVIGIIQGPMNSATGRLYLCDQADCSPLFISTADAFLINYAAQVSLTSPSFYIVMSIDYQTIQVFINPEVQPNGQPILSNYTINYMRYVDEPYCSVLKILNISMQDSWNVLSCSKYYYFVRIQFATGVMQILKNFSRYSQCSLEDEFKPSALWNQQGLQVLFAACRQNSYMLKLQAFQTINSSTPIIYTGYLQIFIMSGPLGPNCSNTSTSASKIIPLSSSMDYSLSMTYSIRDANGDVMYKFIYSEISGVLIDNIVKFQPSIQVQYEPFVLQYSYPSIKFYAINQYHHITTNISTTQLQTNPSLALNIVAFTIFTISNVITLLCLICYLCQKRNQRDSILRMQRDSTGISGVGVGEELQYDDSGKEGPVASLRKRETTVNGGALTGLGVLSNPRKTNRPSEIQMYFVKRK